MVRSKILAIFAFLILMASFTVAIPTGTVSAADHSCTKSTFFGLEPWYQYLPEKWNDATKHCEIGSSASTGEVDKEVLGTGSYILLIVLAVIDDLLRIAGIAAVAFIIVGGFKFITAQGEPEAAASARKSIMFALVGLVVALISVVIVSFIGNAIGK